MQRQTRGACMNLPSAAGSIREGKMTGFTGGSDRMACGQQKLSGSTSSLYLQQYFGREKRGHYPAQALAYEQKTLGSQQLIH